MGTKICGCNDEQTVGNDTNLVNNISIIIIIIISFFKFLGQ